MNRKIIAGISLGLLFFAFGLVSLLVILTKRHLYFVGKKLRLGALILSISGASVGCYRTSCYVPGPTPNTFHIDQAITRDSIVIHKSISDTITGRISGRPGNTFSYALFNSSDSIVHKDDIQAIDGNFDEDFEEFRISFGPAIPPGSYDLNFYNGSKNSIQHDDWYERSYTLTITE